VAKNSQQRSRRTLTEAERAQRREHDRQTMLAAVEQLRSSEGWQRWLTSRRHFRPYSLSNQLLIAYQRPSAQRVAGFRAWLAMGYCVMRGQRAIRIWAPMSPSKRAIAAWQAAGADPAERPRIWFKLAPVFDRLSRVRSGDVADRLPALVALAGAIGSHVAFEPVAGDAHGYYELATRRIVIDTSLPANARVKTLVHELSHALLRAEPAEEDLALTRAEEELVVEATAYRVCGGALGLDTAGYSIPYLASWSQQTPLATIERRAGLIDRLARRIEKAAAPGPGTALAP
jgi:hypothetical protein